MEVEEMNDYNPYGVSVLNVGEPISVRDLIVDIFSLGQLFLAFSALLISWHQVQVSNGHEFIYIACIQTIAVVIIAFVTGIKSHLNFEERMNFEGGTVLVVSLICIITFLIIAF